MGDNVKKARGRDNIPKVYEQRDPMGGGDGKLHEPIYPPETIKREVSLAGKKAKMSFNYEPQMADKHTEGPDSGEPADKGVGADHEGGSDAAKRMSKGRITHRGGVREASGNSGYPHGS